MQIICTVLIIAYTPMYVYERKRGIFVHKTLNVAFTVSISTSSSRVSTYTDALSARVVTQRDKVWQ